MAAGRDGTLIISSSCVCLCQAERNPQKRRWWQGTCPAARTDTKAFWHRILQALNCKREELLWFPSTAFQGGGKKWSLNEEGCVVQTLTLRNLLLTKTGPQQSPKCCLSTRYMWQVSCQGQAVHRNCIFGHNSAMLTMYLFTPKRKIRFLEELSTFFPLQ